MHWEEIAQSIVSGAILLLLSTSIGVGGWCFRRMCRRFDWQDRAIKRLLRAAGLPEHDEDEAR